MTAAKSKSYGCRVRPGETRKGCGAGADVFELKKKVKEQDKRLAAIEAEQERKAEAAKKLDKQKRSGHKPGHEPKKKAKGK